MAWSETPRGGPPPSIPVAPYGVPKLYAYWTTVNYLRGLRQYACNGQILSTRKARAWRNLRDPQDQPVAWRGSLPGSIMLFHGNLDLAARTGATARRITWRMPVGGCWQQETPRRIT